MDEGTRCKFDGKVHRPHEILLTRGPGVGDTAVVELCPDFLPKLAAADRRQVTP
jgi:hypothetical protein